MPGLTEGRIVHYVLDTGRNAGEHRPAIIVKIWNAATGYCNLLVFLDGGNDDETAPYPAPLMRWATSVNYSEDPQPRTWHWIEKA